MAIAINSKRHPAELIFKQSLPNDISASATKAWLLALLFLALIIRIYLCFGSGLSTWSTDTYDYIRMADGILNGQPISFFPNGFPLLIAAVKIAGGEEHLATNLLVLNILMSTCVVLATFFVAQSIMTRQLALAATALVAFWPNQLNFVRQILSEVPSTFFLTLAIALMLRARSFSSGMLFSAATLVRSSLFPIAPLAALCLLWGRKRLEAFWLITGFAFIIGMELALIKFGILKGASNIGTNLLIAIHNNSTHGIDFSLGMFSEQEKGAPLMTYLSFAVSHPIEFLSQRLSSAWELWGPWPGVGDAPIPRSTVTRLLIGLRFPALILAVLAIWVLRSRPQIWLIATPILVVTVTHVLFFSTSRFTYPVEPSLLILAVLGSVILVRSSLAWRIPAPPASGARTAKV